MWLGRLLQKLRQVYSGNDGAVQSWEQEIEAARGIVGRHDGGYREVPTVKVVGSVGRADDLRSDFFHKRGRAITGRYLRIGQAMEAGTVLPPIEVYKVKVDRPDGPGAARKRITEYYVVDGHHRVAMAKRLGQDYLDAHVVEYTLAPSGRTESQSQ